MPSGAVPPRSAGARSRLSVTAGLVLLLIGGWSLFGGGCTIVAAGALQAARSGLALSGAAQVGQSCGAAATKKWSGAQVGRSGGAAATSDFEEQRLPLELQGQDAGPTPRSRSALAFALVGGLVLLGGVACVVAGILVVVARGRAMSALAAALVAAGELLSLVLLGFSWAGVAKLALVALALWGAWVSVPVREADLV